MSKNKLELGCGIVVILLQIFGFPRVWNEFFYWIIGLILIGAASSGYIERRKKQLNADNKTVDIQNV